MQANPATSVLRSPIYRELKAAGAQFTSFGDGAIAGGFGAPGDETVALPVLALADLSPLPRIGFKGWGLQPWLSVHDWALPAQNNSASVQRDGAIVARLSDGEVFAVTPVTGQPNAFETLERAWHAGRPNGCFFVPRGHSHCEFMLTGAQAPAVLATLCAVNLAADVFPNMSVAQTSFARVNGLVIRADIPHGRGDGRGGVSPAFRMAVDRSLAAYLWACLTDALRDHGGRLVGIDALIGTPR